MYELLESLQARLSYSQGFRALEFSGGIKNILNSYQDDFDTGIDRDPGYIYGPLTPRTVFIGLRFGNLLSPEGGTSISSQQENGPVWGKPTRSEKRRVHRNHRHGGRDM